MKNDSIVSSDFPTASVDEAWQDVGESFERFCLTAGQAALERMFEEDTARLCGPRHGRGGHRTGYRWGETSGRIGFHGGKVAVRRPRVRARDGDEMPLPSWTAAVREDWLGRWALNLTLINVGNLTSKEFAEQANQARKVVKLLEQSWGRVHRLSRVA